MADRLKIYEKAIRDIDWIAHTSFYYSNWDQIKAIRLAIEELYNDLEKNIEARKKGGGVEL